MMELRILDVVMVLIGRCWKYTIDCLLFVSLNLSVMWREVLEVMEEDQTEENDVEAGDKRKIR